MTMDKKADKNDKDLAISVAPLLKSTVEYFTSRRIELNITNLLPGAVLLEDVTLCFQPDSGSADIYVETRLGVQVPANEVAPVSIDVRPTTEYLEYTNCFNVLLHYRLADRLEQRLTARRDRASFIIIRRPNNTIADVFISFKQMEDISLARMLELHAQRAGLNPYIVINEPDPGKDQWVRIEEAIKKSKAAFIIWGSRTEWGTGVQREVAMCRRHGVEEVLLLHRNIEVPELFKPTKKEYLRFDPDNPREAFAKAVESTRNRFISRLT